MSFTNKTTIEDIPKIAFYKSPYTSVEIAILLEVAFEFDSTELKDGKWIKCRRRIAKSTNGVYYNFEKLNFNP